MFHDGIPVPGIFSPEAAAILPQARQECPLPEFFFKTPAELFHDGTKMILFWQGDDK